MGSKVTNHRPGSKVTNHRPGSKVTNCCHVVIIIVLLLSCCRRVVVVLSSCCRRVVVLSSCCPAYSCRSTSVLSSKSLTAGHGYESCLPAMPAGRQAAPRTAPSSDSSIRISTTTSGAVWWRTPVPPPTSESHTSW